MNQLNQEEVDPCTNESCVVDLHSRSFDSVAWKNAKRIPLADIKNV